MLDKKLTRQTKVLVRLYVLEVTGMYFAGSEESVDPYLQIKLGDIEINNRDEH